MINRREKCHRATVKVKVMQKITNWVEPMEIDCVRMVSFQQKGI